MWKNEWWAGGKKKLLFLHSTASNTIAFVVFHLCRRLWPAKELQKKKEISISSWRKLNARICHQNCSSLLASGLVLSFQRIFLCIRLAGPSWVTPASRQYRPVISIHPPQHFLLRSLTSPNLGKLLSSLQPFTPVYLLLPFDLVASWCIPGQPSHWNTPSQPCSCS